MRRFILWLGISGAILVAIMWIFLNWNRFDSISEISIQRSVASMLGIEYFVEDSYHNEGFRKMFLNPTLYVEEVDSVLMDATSSVQELQIAGELVQCRSKDQLYRLAHQISENFDKKMAAIRLEKIFLPPPYASTYEFKRDIEPNYLMWLRYIEENHPTDYFPDGLNSYLEDGRAFYSGAAASASARDYPLIICSNKMNVADLSVHEID